MDYKWINKVTKLSDDHTSITFNDEFNDIIKPNSLPELLTTLDLGYSFNQKIVPNTLPNSLTYLDLGFSFDQKIEPNSLPNSLTYLDFGYKFNQIIELNSLPESLTNLTFRCNFNQKIDLNILPSKLKYIEFGWIYLSYTKINISRYIEMVNNIPGYYDVKIFLLKNIFGDNGPKWPMHVCNYKKKRWPLEIYEVIDNYTHSFYGDITILINTETYQSYSFAKSAFK